MTEFLQKLEVFFAQPVPGFILKVIIALLVIAIGSWLSRVFARMVRRAMDRAHAEAGLISFVSSSTKLGVQLLAVFAAVVVLGIPVGNIVTLISASAVAIGLALRDSLANVASGIIILATKPFVIGEVIEVDGNSGTVSAIHITSTRITTFDNRSVIVPNSKMTSSTIINVSHADTRRLDAVYSIGYDADIDQARDIVLACAKDCTLIHDDPAPRCVVKEHADSAILLGGYFWVDTSEYANANFEMNERVKKAFDKAGIEIPYTELSVTLKRTDA